MAVPQWSLAPDYSPREGDLVVLPFLDRRRPAFSRALLPGPLASAIRTHGERGGVVTIFAGRIGGATVRARVVRLDAEHATVSGEARRMVASAVSLAKKEGSRRIVAVVGTEGLAAAAHEGAVLGGYAFDRYLKKKTRPPAVLIVVPGHILAATRRLLAERETLLRCVNEARDLLNEPPNVIRPDTLAREFRRLGKASGLRVTVWEEDRLRREGCGGILGVGGGARAKPRLVIGEYAPRGAAKHICLVGKGVTFDSGGYGLKPADSQVGMKYDMGGAAMMFAAACAAARLRLPIRVTVMTPLVENAISADAYHTTSILTTRSGRTIEVQHTDAEGRIILADALTLAAERKPDWIVDAATLTGACVVALGEEIAGAFGTDASLTRLFIEAGVEEGELFWELPLHMPYQDQIKATVADCKNIGSRWGGSIIGAVFLKAWVPDGIRWIHCDIAGPACKEEALGHVGKGAKGFGVKSVVALLRRLSR